MRRTRIVGVLGALVGLTMLSASAGAIPAWARADNLVGNHSFESPFVGSGSVTYSEGANIDGWIVGAGTVDLLGTSWQAATGDQSLDVSGTGAGGVFQDIATSPGVTYALAFAMAGNPDCGGGVKKLGVGWNGQVVARFRFDTTGHDRQHMGWRPRGVVVTATGFTTRLTFVSGTNSACGPTIDDVLVQPR